MNKHYALLPLCTAVLALTLAGCGGGGGGSDPVPTPTPNPTPVSTTAALQGIWQSPAGTATNTSAIVLPDGQLWAVIVTAGTPVSTRVIKARFAPELAGFTGSGTSYALGTNISSSLTATASVIEKTSLAATFSSNGQSDAYSLAYQSRYDTLVSLADWQGSWSGTLGPGTVSWNIAASGAISGTRSTGCIYSGQVSLRQEQKAIADVSVTESCAGTVTQLAGIGTLVTGKAATLAMTTADGSAAVLLGLTR